MLKGLDPLLNADVLYALRAMGHGDRLVICGQPKEVPPGQQEVQAAIDRAEGKSWPMVGVERHAFYEQAKGAYCVIATGERRFYGCFLFTKGVIPPDGAQ